MTNEDDSDSHWVDGGRAWLERKRQKEQRHVNELSSDWTKKHRKRCSVIETDLVKERGNVSADEKLLLGLASHDIALSEILARTELQLAQRSLALVDNVTVGLMLARTLRQIGVCREGAARRARDLLQAAGVIRGQRKLAEVVPLRRAS